MTPYEMNWFFSWIYTYYIFFECAYTYDSYIGKAKMYFTSSNKEPLLNGGYLYSVNLLDEICELVEDDHMMHWIPIDSVKDYLFHEHHAWAV